MTEPTPERSRVGALLMRPNGWVTLGGICVLYLGFLVLPQVARGDDAVRVVMLRQLAEGIKPETKYSFIQPVVSLPAFWILDHLGFGVFAFTLLPLIWLAIWCLVVWRLLAREKGPVLAHHAVVLSLASLLSAYVVGFGSDVFTALAVSGGVVAMLLSRTRAGRVGGWLAIVVGAANTPPMLVGVVLLAVWLVVSRRQVRFAALPVLVFCLAAFESTVVSGRLGWTRYSRSVEHGEVPLLPWGDVAEFGWPLWSGLLAVLFSFGRGLLFFIPQLWNGPTRGTRDSVIDVERALWVVGIALIPLYAKWWAWFGGVSFGPRFFLILVFPAALAGATAICAPTTRTRSVVSLLALVASVWVAITGAVFGVTVRAFDMCVAGGTFSNFVLCLYTPEYSGLWVPLWVPRLVGVRGACFAIAMIVLIVPTLVTVISSLRDAPADWTRRAAGHLRQTWSV